MESRLRSFLGSQFHNAWPEVFGTWDNAIDDYCKRKTAESLLVVLQELDELIGSNFDEESLRGLVKKEFSANFYPPGAGLSYRQWFELIRAITAEWLKKKQQEASKR